MALSLYRLHGTGSEGNITVSFVCKNGPNPRMWSITAWGAIQTVLALIKGPSAMYWTSYASDIFCKNPPEFYADTTANDP